MRYAVAIGAVLLIIAGLVAVKFTQISGLMKMGKEMQAAGPPAENVTTTVSKDEAWEQTLDAVGTVTAARGVSISNEVAGTVVGIHFESGKVVRAGEVLVDLDSTVERAQLAALDARRELANLNTQRSRALVASQAIAKSQLDSDEALSKSSKSDLGALEAQIARKVVRAPFSGKLGIRQVNIGQYLQPGSVIAVLESTDALYIDFTLPQQNLPDVKNGMAVRVTLDDADAGGAIEGTIKAVDPSVDATTRTIKVRASLPADDRLRSGMFANVSVILPAQKNHVTVPALAVIHASYGDSIFVVGDKPDPTGAPAKYAEQKFVKTAAKRGDFVALEAGLEAGKEIVVAGAFKLQNGSKIAIDNKLAPKPQMDPHPENH